MKPNTALIKYKDQPVVNLNSTFGVYLPKWENPRSIIFGHGEAGSVTWVFETSEEAQSVYKKICSLFVTDLT